MKKIIFTALAILVIAISLIAINKRMNKGNLMDNNNTYMVIAPNGMEIPFDKNTNLSVSPLDYGSETIGVKEHSQMLLDSRSILDSSL
nr:hypothetical protein [Campylobacter concisus]